MGKNLATKLAIIVAVLLFFIYGIVGPHSTEHGLRYSLKQTLADNIHLGLDLKGGTHLVVGVHVKEALVSATDRDVQRIDAALGGGGITGATVSKPDAAHPESITVSGLSAAQSSQARSLVGTNEYAAYDVARQPDGSLRLTMKQSAISDLEARTLDTTIEVISDRINKLGVSEPTIQKYGLGDNQILVELPGEADPTRIENAIQSKDEARNPRRRRQSLRLRHRPGRARRHGRSPAARRLPRPRLRFRERARAASTSSSAPAKWKAPTSATRSPSTDINGRPNITFNLTTEAGDRFFKYTDAHKSSGATPGSMAIVLGNRVREVAGINSGIRDSGEITGGFSQQEAENLSLMLRTGALARLPQNTLKPAPSARRSARPASARASSRPSPAWPPS